MKRVSRFLRSNARRGQTFGVGAPSFQESASHTRVNRLLPLVTSDRPYPPIPVGFVHLGGQFAPDPLCSREARRRCFSSESNDRESLEYDVVIVGAGPAGLSAAIRLKQLCQEQGTDLSVCVLEKGAEVGAHILSGNVFETRALDELIPEWRQEGAPIEVPVSSDRFYFLTRNHAVPLPSPFENDGNYVIRS